MGLLLLFRGSAAVPTTTVAAPAGVAHAVGGANGVVLFEVPVVLGGTGKPPLFLRDIRVPAGVARAVGGENAVSVVEVEQRSRVRRRPRKRAERVRLRPVTTVKARAGVAHAVGGRAGVEVVIPAPLEVRLAQDREFEEVLAVLELI